MTPPNDTTITLWGGPLDGQTVPSFEGLELCIPHKNGIFDPIEISTYRNDGRYVKTEVHK